LSATAPPTRAPSASRAGDIAPEILTRAAKGVRGLCYCTCSAEQVAGSLSDACGYHWDKGVLDAM
jgi:hypothetical protein